MFQGLRHPLYGTLALRNAAVPARIAACVHVVAQRRVATRDWRRGRGRRAVVTRLHTRRALDVRSWARDYIFMPAMLSAAVCLVLLLAGCSAGGGAVPHLHPCELAEGPPDAYCGTLRVFEDRDARTGRTIDLKIVVAPALRRDARPDPLFVFEGGPGGGAATLAPYRIPMFRRFQTDRDIVLVDQRGTGASNSLDCSDGHPEEEGFKALDDYPIARYQRCLETLQADPRLYTTAIAMDDVDDVRAFLGYSAINLWGGSYGTRAALVYLQRHEPWVRTVVLDGVAPPDMQLPLYMARDSQRALDRLVDDCARDEVCRSRFPELRRTIDRLWARLADRPTIDVTNPRTGKPDRLRLSQRLVATIVFQTLYAPELSSLLPRLLTDAADGRFQGLLALAYSRDLPKGAMSDGMFLSVVCSEDFPRFTSDDISREAEGRFFGTTMFDTQMKPCGFWPRGSVEPSFYAPIASSRPVLVFSGENDPVTPPSWGEQVAARMPNARHFVVPGAGHITLTRGCVPELVADFLARASAADLDGTCLGALSRPPFFTSYTGPERP
jgi:pimeloyl-ACP methyl ester carboxylesterase